MAESTGDVSFLRRLEDPTLNDETLARDAGILNDYVDSETPIRNFLKDRVILVTGGTGFLGKILIDKLLRSCPDIRAVFMLVRKTKYKNINERMEEYFKNSVFTVLEKNQPNYRRKIYPVEGDISQENLGLSVEDKAKLQDQVSVIFHLGAVTRNDEPFKYAALTNVLGTGSAIQLARGCARLAAFVYVSSVYSACDNWMIDEKFYTPPIKPGDLMKTLEKSDDDLNQLLPELLGKFPNVHTFTKSVAEDIVRELGAGMPCCVVRLSNLVGSYREPIRGWADNLTGVSSFIVGAATGVIRTIQCDRKANYDVVPVDMAANFLIASAWQTSTHGLQNDEAQVYNYVSSAQKPISFGDFYDMNAQYFASFPSMNAVWYSCTMLTNCWYFHMLCVIFLHYIPAILSDAMSSLTGKKATMFNLYKKINILCNNLTYFTNQEWTIKNNNCQRVCQDMNVIDQHIYLLDMEKLDWQRLCETLLIGLRVYVLKEPTSTLAKARQRWQSLRKCHMSVKYSSILIIILTVFYVISSIF